jgi:hypothetical protein
LNASFNNQRFRRPWLGRKAFPKPAENAKYAMFAAAAICLHDSANGTALIIPAFTALT